MVVIMPLARIDKNDPKVIEQLIQKEKQRREKKNAYRTEARKRKANEVMSSAGPSKGKLLKNTQDPINELQQLREEIKKLQDENDQLKKEKEEKAKETEELKCKNRKLLITGNIVQEYLNDFSKYDHLKADKKIKDEK